MVVVEQTFALLDRFKRLAVRWERRLDLHDGLVSLACALICWRLRHRQPPGNRVHDSACYISAVTFYEDLSPYAEEPEETFWEGEGTRVVTFTPRYTRINVGWLAADHPFAVGSPPPGFVDQLARILHGQYVNPALGTHPCELCETADEDTPRAPRGSSEIRVPSSPTVVYAAPFLISHYVQAHRYLPPRPFIDAVLDSHDTWRNGPPAPWLPDDAQRLDFEAGD